MLAMNDDGDRGGLDGLVLGRYGLYMVRPKVPKPRKTLPAVFYRTAAGNEPARAELKGRDFDGGDRRLVGRDVAKVEFGWPGIVGHPTCEKLDGDLYAVRTHLPGNRIARVLFAPYEKRMLLLRAFIKKATDGIKTPRREIGLAERRFADAKARATTGRGKP